MASPSSPCFLGCSFSLSFEGYKRVIFQSLALPRCFSWALRLCIQLPILDEFPLHFWLLAAGAMADEYLLKDCDLWDSKTLGKRQVSVKRKQESLQ